MKKVLFGIISILLLGGPSKAVKLEEFLSINDLGEGIADWAPSPLVPGDLVGKTFSLNTEGNKIYQLRFVTFEDRKGQLKNVAQFKDFVKTYGLGSLESKNDATPYRDETLQSFTFKDANDYLISQGKAPLPEGVFFVISFRDVTDILK